MPSSGAFFFFPPEGVFFLFSEGVFFFLLRAFLEVRGYRELAVARTVACLEIWDQLWVLVSGFPHLLKVLN